MTSTNERFRHYLSFSAPTPDSKHYDRFINLYEGKFKNDAEHQRKSKEKFRKAISILNTQLQNGAGLLVDSEFRYFLSEFNERNFQYGFASMPAAFNVLEAFFSFNRDLFLFELFEEEDYLFSFFDFIDFVTSDQCSRSVAYLKESIDDNVIYSYNILNDPTELTFRTDGGQEYIFAGLSFIKRGDELSMFIVAGEKADIEEETNKLVSLDKTDFGRSYITPASDRKREVVRLNGMNDYRKVFIYLRVNLETKTIDTRYIQKDEGNSFSTLTDDFDMFVRTTKDKGVPEEYIKNSIDQLKSYDAIFEVAYNCLYLPEYFDKNENDIVVEEHPTALGSTKVTPALFKKDKKYSAAHFLKTKDVWTLDKNNNKLNANTLIHGELTFDSTGYWKHLDIGQIGEDKKGKKIHNRTWVTQTLSWYESKKDDNAYVNIKAASSNSGYIYILHNPGHPVNLFKIGLTTKTVEERAKQLSGTPSVDKFLIAHSWPVKDCVVAEKIIHQKLESYRLNEKREFFQISFEEALKIISPIIEEINKES